MVQCQGCENTFEAQDIFFFGSCEHEMCTICLEGYIQANKLQGAITICCPFDPINCAPLSDSLVSTFATKILAKQLAEVRLERKKDFIAAGLFEVQNLVICPNPECCNATFTAEPPKLEAFEVPSREDLVEKCDTIRSEFVDEISSLVSNLKLIGGTGAFVDQNLLNAQEVVINKIVKDVQSFQLSNALAKFFTNEEGKDIRRFKCEECTWHTCILCGKHWDLDEQTHEQLSCEEFNHAIELSNKLGVPPVALKRVMLNSLRKRVWKNRK